MLKEQCAEVNAGWESYYLNAGDVDLWKDEVEPFLLENYSLIAQNKRAQVLDIGCGDGRNSFPWIKNNHHVSCLDVAESGLFKLRDKCLQMDLQPPKLMCQDFLEAPLAEGGYDVVQCFDALAQINDVHSAVNKLCKVAKSCGYIIFNYFTPGDCAYGEGEQVDDRTFVYKDTLFKFHTEEEIIKMLGNDVEVIISETRRWDDPPHGDYRPYAHTHEAAFFLLRKI